MTTPQTMTAIDPEQPGGPEVLQAITRPVPVAGPGEVLIRVAAAGVNRPDVLQRLGLYPMPPGAPSIPGLEVSGEIVTGSGRWQVGDKVCALIAGGGYAEYAVAPAGQCLPVPEGVDLIDAAGLPETYFTVWSNLFQRGKATAGETALIHGGTSGIGVTAILLCKALGLQVIVTAGSAAKCEAALALGADHAIDYKAQDFVAEVARITGGRGVEVVLDMVGGDYIPRNIVSLADEGRHVSIALQRGPKVEINFGDVMRKRLHLSGSMLRSRPVTFKAAVAAELERIAWPLFAAGQLRAVTDKLYPLAEAAEAHRRMEAGDHVGKILLTMTS
jgi:NADPH2:quinone reductase